MLSITADCPGEVGVREMMLGMVVVGLVAGVFLGRNTEKSRRSFQDRTASRTTYDKYRKTVWADTRRAAVTIVVVGAVLLALLFGYVSSLG